MVAVVVAVVVGGGGGGGGAMRRAVVAPAWLCMMSLLHCRFEPLHQLIGHCTTVCAHCGSPSRGTPAAALAADTQSLLVLELLLVLDRAVVVAACAPGDEGGDA